MTGLRILFLSHTSRVSPFRVGSHHLAREFAAMGHTVGHVSNPVSPAHLARLGDPEVRARLVASIPPRLHRVDGAWYAVPWAALPVDETRAMPYVPLGSTRWLRRELEAVGVLPADIVFVDQPLLVSLLRHLPHTRVVYRPTDIHLADRVRAVERNVLGLADTVVATSRLVAAQLPYPDEPLPVTVVENGVETGRFGGVARPWTSRAGSVYVGALDDRFDWGLVRQMAQAEPDEPIDLYGPRADAPFALPPNVRLRGEIDYDDVPGVLAEHRVGLLPLSSHPANDGRSPMKLYEYLAAGLRVLMRTGQAPGLDDVDAVSREDEARSTYRFALRVPPTGDGRAAALSMDWSARARLVLDALNATERTSDGGAPAWVV